MKVHAGRESHLIRGTMQSLEAGVGCRKPNCARRSTTSPPKTARPRRATAAPAAAAKPDFSRTWQLDKNNSEGLPPGMDQILTIVQTGDKLSLETRLITGEKALRVNSESNEPSSRNSSKPSQFLATD